MPTHRDKITKLTTSQLSELTGFDTATIRKRLGGLEPVEKNNRCKLYEPRAALQLLYGQANNPQQEKARLDKLRADKVELDLQVMRKELVEVEAVAKAWTDMAFALKTRIMTIPTRAAPLVFGCKTIPQVKAELEELFIEVLNELADADTDKLCGLKVSKRDTPAKTTKRKRVGRRKKDSKS